MLRDDDETTCEIVTPPILGALGKVTGTASISSNQGIATPQSSLELCCHGTLGLGVQGIADSDGNYELFEPLGVSGTNYSNLTLSVFNFEFLKEHRKVQEQEQKLQKQEATIMRQQKDFESKFVQRQKQIEALIATVRKVSE